MKRRKRGLCLALVLSLVLSLAGCGGVEKTQADDGPEEIKGRYVEKTMSLPPCQAVYDMVMLEDGGLRVALARKGGQGMVYTTGPDRDGWADIRGIPSEIQDRGMLDGMALSPDGTVFCYVWGKEGTSDTYRLYFWVLDPEGSCRELPVDLGEAAAEDTVYLIQCDFTDSGRLFAQFDTGEVREIDLETGELGENLNEFGPPVQRLGCAGESVYLVGEDSISAHLDGQTTALDNAMGQDLLASLGGGSIPRCVFWQNAEGYVFYTTPQGLFSYIPGGSVVEELVSGSRASLSDRDFLPAAMTGGEDGSFYVLGTRLSTQEPLLLCYVYDENADTALDNTLKVYVLHEDMEFPELIGRYRATHPDVAVELEMAIPRDDMHTTEGDAIRALNTKMLAGDGPDLICLDGLNVDSYLEKGALLDLSQLLAEADPTITTVTECYKRDGQICAIPVGFDIPVVYGPEHIISQIHDLDSLVAAVTQLKEERPDDLGILRAVNPSQFADQLYDGCISALFNEDGTLSEEKLTQYFQAMKALYDLDADLQARYPQYARTRTNGMDVGQYVGVMGSVYMVYHDCSVGFGPMRGMLVWYLDMGAREELPGYVTGKLDVGSKGTFMPQFTMGVLANSQHPETAMDCIRFLLSEEIQEKNINKRLPVNQAAFEAHASRQLSFPMPTGRKPQVGVGTLDRTSDVLHFEPLQPTEEDRANLRRWVSEIATPVPTDRIMRRLIIAQMTPCLLGEITPEEAAGKAMQTLELYLAE